MISPRRLKSLKMNELIKLKRDISLQIALLRYDFEYSVYLNHPLDSFSSGLEDLNDLLSFRLLIRKELEKRNNKS